MNKKELVKKYEETIYAIIATDEVLKDLKQLDEPQKPVVPHFVADWIEYCKRHNFTLFGCLDPVDNFGSLVDENFEGDARKCIRWCRSESDKIARAWLDGYEVEKEKRYLVKMKGVSEHSNYLNYDSIDDEWYLTDDENGPAVSTYHTRKQLEEAGFGEVFNSPLFEVKKVE